MLKSLIKDSSIYVIGDFIFRSLNYLTLPLFALYFNVEEFGLLSLMLAGIQFCTVLFNLGGITSGVGRYFWTTTNPPLLISTGLYTSMGIGFICSVILMIIHAYFPLEIFQEFVFLMVLNGFVAAIYNYALQVLRFHFACWKFTLHSLFMNVLTLILRLYAVYILHKGIEGYLIATLAGVTAAFPLLLFSIRKEIHFTFSASLAKLILKFSYPLLFVSVANWLCGMMDRVMLSQNSTLAELGYYSIGFKLMTVIQIAFVAFSQAWQMYATQCFEKHNERFHLFFKQTMTLWSFFLVAIGGALSLFSTEILMMAFPKEYLPAQQCCVILSIGMIFLGISQITSLPISMHKKNYLHMIIGWLAVGINFCLNSWWIPLYGAIGASIATTMTYVLMTTLYYFLSNRIERIELDRSKLSYCFFFLMIMSALAWGLQMQPWAPIHLLIKGSLFIAFNLGAWFILKEERDVIIKAAYF